jgi:pimeloyl-ACP methyl ester carboxylesterase
MTLSTFAFTGQRHCLTVAPELQLAYWEWPTGDTPVLMLHGLADHGLVWANLAQSLGAPYDWIAPDLRGHGESGKPTRGYRCADMIGDLETLMGDRGWTSAHVIAHSWAAKIATVWATQHPQRLRSLILVDPFFIDRMPSWIQLSFPVLYRVLPFLRIMGPFPTWERAEQVAQGLKQYQGWSPYQQAVFRAGMEQKSDGQWGSKFVIPARDEIFDDVMRVAGLTQPLTLPTLLIQPEQGLNRTAWQLRPYRRYFPQLQIQAVPGNHWPFLVAPEHFNAVVSRFWQSLG